MHGESNIKWVYVDPCSDHWPAGRQLRGPWQVARQEGLLRQSKRRHVVVGGVLVLPGCHRVAGVLLRAAVQFHQTDGEGHEPRLLQNEAARDPVQLQDTQQQPPTDSHHTHPIQVSVHSVPLLIVTGGKLALCWYFWFDFDLANELETSWESYRNWSKDKQFFCLHQRISIPWTWTY